MLKALMSDWADFKDRNMSKKTPKQRSSGAYRWELVLYQGKKNAVEKQRILILAIK